jgi:hypothetical protein
VSVLPLVHAAVPVPPSIDLRCCGVEALLGEVCGASLVVADPPWTYNNAGTRGNASDEYDTITIEDIARHLDAAWDCAGDDAYLLCWAAWPLLLGPDGWAAASAAMRWRYVSGGAWSKTGGLGVGFHWRGDSEFALLYVKGSPRPVATIRNTAVTPRRENGRHSEKPLPWARDHVRAFCPPGGLVLDLYAGMAPYARACLVEGRAYVGAEIDPQRHADALGLLAGRVGVR